MKYGATALLCLLFSFPWPAATSPVDLSNTSWQLVRIMSMDDAVDEPEDRSLYMLEFDVGDVSRRRPQRWAPGPEGCASATPWVQRFPKA